MTGVLVIGATSRIAEMTARRYAAGSARLCLLARNEAKCAAVADDLRVRGATDVLPLAFDASDPQGFAPALELACRWLGRVDVALVAHGELLDQERFAEDPARIRRFMQVNATSIMELCERLFRTLSEQGSGTLTVVASVAGLRGRQSNYVYGASKAALIAYCSGLRQRAQGSGVRILTVLPGPVDTPMTATHAKSAIFATADRVADDIVAAIARGRRVLYTPWYWRPIMWVVTRLPEPIFLRKGPR